VITILLKEIMNIFVLKCEVRTQASDKCLSVLCIAVFKIILGTLENEASADVEWQHARYLRTAKKRKFLSAE